MITSPSLHKLKVSDWKRLQTNFLGEAEYGYLMPGAKVKHLTGVGYDVFDQVMKMATRMTFEDMILQKAGTVEADFNGLYSWEIPNHKYLQRRLMNWATDENFTQKADKPGVGRTYIWLEFEGKPYGEKAKFNLNGDAGTLLIEEAIDNGVNTIYRCLVHPQNDPTQFIDASLLDNPSTRFSDGVYVAPTELSGPQGHISLEGTNARIMNKSSFLRLDLHISNSVYAKSYQEGDPCIDAISYYETDERTGIDSKQVRIVDKFMMLGYEKFKRMRNEEFVWGRASGIDEKDAIRGMVKSYTRDSRSQTPIQTCAGFMELVAPSSNQKYSRMTVKFINNLIQDRYVGLLPGATLADLKLELVLAPKVYQELLEDIQNTYGSYFLGNAYKDLGIMSGNVRTGGISIAPLNVQQLMTVFGCELNIVVDHSFANLYNQKDMSDFFMILDYSPITINGTQFSSNINKIRSSNPYEQDTVSYVPGARDFMGKNNGTIGAPAKVAGLIDGTDITFTGHVGCVVLDPSRIVMGSKNILYV